jgi:uncharacterized membrane protein HdeD (DUF308 family)
MNQNLPVWNRAVEVGLGVPAIILSASVLVHPGITIVSIMYIAGIILIVVGIEKIISAIFVANKSRWGAVGLGVLAIIFTIPWYFPCSVWNRKEPESGLGKRI